MKKSLLSLILIAGLSLVGCSNRSAGTATNVEQPIAETAAIVDYGNGVYYFPYIEADFGNALSKFRGNHPELIQTAMVANGTDFYGYNLGYFVTFEKR